MSSIEAMQLDEKGGRRKDTLKIQQELQRLFQRIYLGIVSQSKSAPSNRRPGYSGIRTLLKRSSGGIDKEDNEGPHLLADFMLAAGERITILGSRHMSCGTTCAPRTTPNFPHSMTLYTSLCTPL